MEDKDKVTAAIERLNELGRTDLAMAICNAIANRDEELSEARRLLDEAKDETKAHPNSRVILKHVYARFGIVGGEDSISDALRKIDAAPVPAQPAVCLLCHESPCNPKCQEAQPAVPDGKFHVPTLEAVLRGLKSEDDSTQLRAIISEVETMLAASKEDGK